jgi:hypothetical protein
MTAIVVVDRDDDDGLAAALGLDAARVLDQAPGEEPFLVIALDGRGGFCVTPSTAEAAARLIISSLAHGLPPSDIWPPPDPVKAAVICGWH